MDVTLNVRVVALTSSSVMLAICPMALSSCPRAFSLRVGVADAVGDALVVLGARLAIVGAAVVSKASGAGEEQPEKRMAATTRLGITDLAFNFSPRIGLENLILAANEFPREKFLTVLPLDPDQTDGIWGYCLVGSSNF